VVVGELQVSRVLDGIEEEGEALLGVAFVDVLAVGVGRVEAVLFLDEEDCLSADFDVFIE